MSQYFLTFKLKSDGAFGRGDGIAGFLDQEVQHDSYGCPYLGGKALKGILVNECADILAALADADIERWYGAANRLFGRPGSDVQSHPLLHVGDARLPVTIRKAIVQDMDSSRPTLTRESVLHSITALRHQTAIDYETGVADDHTLRTVRVVLRETPFTAPLILPDHVAYPDKEEMLMLLAATVKAFRRAGTARNRGYGRLCQVQLTDLDATDITRNYFSKFCQEVQP